MSALVTDSNETVESVQPSSTPSSNAESVNLFTDETIENLTNGFLEILQPEVTRVQKSLEELM